MSEGQVAEEQQVPAPASSGTAATLQLHGAPDPTRPAPLNESRTSNCRALTDTEGLRDPPRIATWNCRSLSADKAAFLLSQSWDILCLQEVWDPHEEELRRLSQAGYDVHITRRSSKARGGTAVLVRRCSFRSEVLQIKDILPVEVTAVSAYSSCGECWRIASVYIPPDVTGDVEIFLLKIFSSVDIAAGDWNARHQSWCPTTHQDAGCQACARGKTLQRVTTSLEWTLNSDVSVRAPTTVAGTALDLVCFAPGIVTTPSVAVPSPSDHHFVTLLRPLAAAPMVRRRVRSILWRRVTPAMLERVAKVLPPSDQSVSAEQLEDALARVVRMLPSTPWTRPDSACCPLPVEPQTDADAWRLLQKEFRVPPPNTPLTDTAGVKLISPRQRARAFLRLFASKPLDGRGRRRLYSSGFFYLQNEHGNSDAVGGASGDGLLELQGLPG